MTTPITDARHTVRASQLIRLLRRNIAVLYTPSVPRHGASREALKGWCLHILIIPQPLPCFHPGTHRSGRMPGFPHGGLINYQKEYKSMETAQLIQVLRQRTRFQSTRGPLASEDLFHLPLEELDEMYRKISRELKEQAEESLLAKKSPLQGTLELKQQVLKLVITDLLEEAEDKKNAKEVVAKRRYFDELIAKKRADGLAELSLEELTKMRQDLG